jgi:hypothetical protein
MTGSFPHRSPVPAFALALAIPLSFLRAQEELADRAFVELALERTTVFVGETVPLRIRIGMDPRFLSEHVVAIFRQALELPVQIDAGALRSVLELRIVDAGEGATIACDDRVARIARVGTRGVGERTLDVYELATPFVARREGEYELPTPRLRFAWAASFSEDFFGDRVPQDRRDAALGGAPLPLRVLPLPLEGRPASFTGALGRYTIGAQATPLALAVGDNLRLVLTIEGDGDLTAFDAPRLHGMPGFDVFGAVEELGPGRRSITYDLAPAHAAVTAVPAIPFAFFDPGPPGVYRIVTSAPIPLVVSGGASVGGAGGPAETVNVQPVDDIVVALPDTSFRAPRRVGLTSTLVALASPWIVATLALAWVGIRRRAHADPLGVRARRAARRFRALRATSADGLATGFAEYLAARLRRPSAAVIANELESELVRAGCAADLSARAARALHGLVASRYGGTPAEAVAASLRSLVDELEAAFVRAEARA